MNNPCVKSVISKSITYTDEFIRIFIAESEKGKLAHLIFEEYGFDIESLVLTGLKKQHIEGVLLIKNRVFWD
ncbi:UNVERIFIED_ORG: hypothetical protein ABIC97_002092 [Peribacillus simplex]